MIKNQKGSTLIVVLILLLLITIIGSLAIRSSLVSLNIATNSQAQQLLIQSSDAAIYKVEDPNFFVRNLALDGLFGFIKSNENKGKELVFCYRGDQTQFFNLSKASVMEWVSGDAPDNNNYGIDGYCKLKTTDNYFTSGRQTVMTQVAVKVLDHSAISTLNEAINPFEYMQQGTDTETAKIEAADRVLIIATSIIPTLANGVTEDQIDECFSGRMNQVAIPADVAATLDANSPYRVDVARCMQNLGVPTNSQWSEYTLAQAFVQN